MMMDSFTQSRPRFKNAPALAVLLAVLCLPAAAFSAPWLQDSREAPLHPTVIMADYKGKSYPVMGASAEFPEVVVDGKTRRLYSKGSYQTPRAVGFGAGFVTFKDPHASSLVRTIERRVTEGMNNRTEISGGTFSASGTYETTLVSTGPLSSCYLAVVYFETDAAGIPLPGTTALAFKQVGDLAPGRETKVTINSSFIPPTDGHYAFFSMVFSKGLEIRTDQSDWAAAYFRRNEMAAHEALLARYRQENPTADKPAAAYLRFRPELPVDVDRHNVPTSVNAKFAVTETGEVDSLELDQVLDVQVDRAIRRALDGWLFMPRLRKGYPVRTMISVPLSFEPGTF